MFYEIENVGVHESRDPRAGARELRQVREEATVA